MKQCLNDLILSRDKKSPAKFELQISSINEDLEYDELELNLIGRNEILYKNIYLIKGEIYPTPKKNDIIYQRIKLHN